MSTRAPFSIDRVTCRSSVQKLVESEKCYKMNIYLQTSASRYPRSSPAKFGSTNDESCRHSSIRVRFLCAAKRSFDEFAQNLLTGSLIGTTASTVDLIKCLMVRTWNPSLSTESRLPTRMCSFTHLSQMASLLSFHNMPDGR